MNSTTITKRELNQIWSDLEDVFNNFESYSEGARALQKLTTPAEIDQARFYTILAKKAVLERIRSAQSLIENILEIVEQKGERGREN